MRLPARPLSLIFCISLPAFAAAQQSPPVSTLQSDPRAIAILQQSLSALSGGRTINDVTLTGTARRIAGSDDETGTAILKALHTGETSIDN